MSSDQTPRKVADHYKLNEGLSHSLGDLGDALCSIQTATEDALAVLRGSDAAVKQRDGYMKATRAKDADLSELRHLKRLTFIAFEKLEEARHEALTGYQTLERARKAAAKV